MGTAKNSGPRSGRILLNEERVEKIFAMRIAKVPILQIAKHFGISKKRVQQIIDEERKRRLPDRQMSVETERQMSVEALDRMALPHWQRVHDPASCAILLRIEERRAALLGLDAPVESRISYSPPAPKQQYDLSKLSFEKLKLLRAALTEAATDQPIDNTPLLEQFDPEESK